MQKLGEGDTLTLAPWMWMESDRQGHRSTCLPLHKINQLLIIRLGSSSKQTMSINNPTTTISFPHTQTFLRKTSRHHGHRSFTGHRLSESSPSLGSTGGAQAVRSGDPAAEAVPLAAATFFAAVTFLYVHLRCGGRRIPEEALFVLCGSVALLDLSLPAQQPGTLQSPLLSAAVARVLPPAAVATFFLAVTLIYAHGHAAGADANQENPAAVELLEKLTLAAALFTCVLSLFAAALVLDTK